MIDIVSSVGRMVKNDTNEFVFFHGTSYLGMTVNEEFHALISIGMKLFGSNYPTSRCSNVRHELYSVFEERLAQWTGFDQAVTVSSGFLAGLLVSSLYNEFDKVYFSPNVHPALNPTYQIGTMCFSDWSKHITQEINNNINSKKRIVIVSNSLDSLRGEVFDFSFLQEIDDSVNLFVIIDDSHGFGILGDEGKGITSLLPQQGNIHYAVVGSLAKAFGVIGGVILCDNNTSEKLRSSAIYSGGSAMSLAFVYAFLNANQIYKKKRKKLLENMAYFNGLIGQKHKLRYDERFPVYYSEAAELYNFCLEQGILVSSFSYPFPDSDRVTRIVINALHEKYDLTKLANTLDAFDEWRLHHQ